MEPFFMYVSIGALVLLILILAAIGVTMTQINSVVPFPSTQNTCPDHWDVSANNPNFCGVPLIGTRNFGNIVKTVDNGITQDNSQNIGMCIAPNKFGCVANGNPYLENTSNTKTAKYHYVKLNNNSKWGNIYPGISERCAQRRWASTLDIAWDGVTNFNGC